MRLKKSSNAVMTARRHERRDWLGTEIDLVEPIWDEAGEYPEGLKYSGDMSAVHCPGDIAITKARELWAQGIKEPTGEPNKIDDMIRGDYGLTWGSADALTWKPGAAYTRNGIFQWCGAFAAYCWGWAGLSSEARRKSWASTWRLYTWAELNKGGGNRRRIRRSEDWKPGDVAIVSRGRKTQGEHITMIDRVDLKAGLVHTIEGNARGRAPSGEIIEGVIKRTRPISAAKSSRWARCPVSGLIQHSQVVWVYRPMSSDLVGW